MNTRNWWGAMEGISCALCKESPNLNKHKCPQISPSVPWGQEHPGKDPGHQSHLPTSPGELCAQVQLSQGSWAIRLRGPRLATSQGRSLHCHPVGGSIVLDFPVKREWRRGAVGFQSSTNPLRQGEGNLGSVGGAAPIFRGSVPSQLSHLCSECFFLNSE